MSKDATGSSISLVRASFDFSSTMGIAGGNVEELRTLDYLSTSRLEYENGKQKKTNS